MLLNNLSQHEKHLREVLKALLKAGLYAKLNKCLFSVIRIPFLSFILTDKGVEMEEDRISTTLNWPEPESVREVQSFLGFLDAGGSQILSRVGSYFYQLTVPRPF